MKRRKNSNLSSKEKSAFIQILRNEGMTTDHFLELMNASSSEIRSWIARSPKYGYPANVFSSLRTGDLLGIRTEYKPPPTPMFEHERIVYAPQHFTTLRSLSRTKAPINLQSEGYSNMELNSTKPGYWGVILPAPGSDNKDQSEQDIHVEGMLGYQRTPIVIGMLLLSLELLATGKNLLEGGVIRFKEKVLGSGYATLKMSDSCFCVGTSTGRPKKNVWASAARWISD